MQKYYSFAVLGAFALTLPAYAATTAPAAQPDQAQLKDQGKSNANKGKSGKTKAKSSKPKSTQTQPHDQHNNGGDHSQHGSWNAHDAGFNGDGRGYWQNGTYWRDGKYYGTSCPPGLAKKNNGCLPPGQAKKQRWNTGDVYPVPYRTQYYIPRAYSDRYVDDGRYTYRYDDGYVYQMDAKSYVITRVIQAVLGD